jgi:hypothetical protein
MPYTLDEFCRDCAASLRKDAGAAGKEEVRANLERLLANGDFIAERLGADAQVGVQTLYRDPELGFCVLAHINREPHASPPHDHGSSWAIYGQATGYTDMTEYRRAGGSGPGHAELEVARRYRLEPGHAGLYNVGASHAIDFCEGARFVRVTGTDLEHVSRLKFDLASGSATAVESAHMRDKTPA